MYFLGKKYKICIFPSKKTKYILSILVTNPRSYIKLRRGLKNENTNSYNKFLVNLVPDYLKDIRDFVKQKGNSFSHKYFQKCIDICTFCIQIPVQCSLVVWTKPTLKLSKEKHSFFI